MSPIVSTRFLQTQPDDRLVALARAGYERAFEALVNRYRRQLLAYCRRLTASDASAEDILQQALLQAWVAIRSDGEVREIRPWLYRIVHNVAISSMRRPSAELVELYGGVGAGGADHEVEQRLEARQALEGLAALPELQREVMLGTAIEGRSHDELAASMGLSNGAVRGLIYRARATLRAAAAVIIPGPLVNWAARQHGGGPVRISEAIAGSGSAGLGGLLLKGGTVIATAGALATATGISLPAPDSRHHRRDPSPARVIARAPAPAQGHAVLVDDRIGGALGSQQSASGSGGSEGHSGPGGSHGSGGHDGSAALRPSASSGGPGRSAGAGPGRGGPSSSESGSSGSGGSGSEGSGGSDGSGSKGSGSGSSSDGAGSGSVASGGSDGGSDHGSHGGASSGRGPGSGTSASPGGSGSDGGSVGSDQGGTSGLGSDGGSTSGSGSGSSGSGSGSDSSGSGPDPDSSHGG